MKLKLTALLICIPLASCQTLRCDPYLFGSGGSTWFDRPDYCNGHKSVSGALEYSVEGNNRSYLFFREGESRRDLFETFFGYRDNKKYCQKALRVAQRKAPKYSYHCVPLPYPDEVKEPTENDLP